MGSSPEPGAMPQMTEYELEGLWVERCLDVAYMFGDKVRFKSGDHAGKIGKVVALFTLEPFPTHVMEFS